MYVLTTNTYCTMLYSYIARYERKVLPAYLLAYTTVQITWYISYIVMEPLLYLEAISLSVFSSFSPSVLFISSNRLLEWLVIISASVALNENLENNSTE